VEKQLKKIGDKLKKLRIAKGYTSAETFAFDNDVNRVQYWRMEKGNNFTINSLMKILEVHKLTLEDFFKGIK
jgi:transcriptional regulator with XRE-family HTH domain